MIEEQAQVVEIKGGDLVLQVQTQSACGSCVAKAGCGTSVLAKVVGRKFTRFQATNKVKAEVGDTVVVGIKEDALVKGSLMMYIVPIIGMLVSALFADYFFTEASYVIESERDVKIALSSITGLLVGSLLSRWYFKRDNSVRLYSPVVLRKIIGHGKL